MTQFRVARAYGVNPIALLRSVTVDEYNELLAALIVMNEQDSSAAYKSYPTPLS